MEATDRIAVELSLTESRWIDIINMSVVEQGEDPQRAVGREQVEIGHAAPEQRVSLAELVLNFQSGWPG
jgi:hypothetical protein